MFELVQDIDEGRLDRPFLMHRCVLFVSWFQGTCYYECVPSVVLLWRI